MYIINVYRFKPITYQTDFISMYVEIGTNILGNIIYNLYSVLKNI